MDSIKIVDKLTIRQEALRMAVEISKSYPKMISDTIKNAGIFEDYIKGKADLPEYVDPQSEHKYFADLIAKMQENFKSNSIPMWLPVDGEIKPPHDADILGYKDGSMYFCKLTKEGDEDVFIINDGCEFHPTHWMPKPIPPFTQPTL